MCLILFLFCLVLSAMIRGAEAESDRFLFQVRDYEEEEVERILENYFDELTKLKCIKK